MNTPLRIAHTRTAIRRFPAAIASVTALAVDLAVALGAASRGSIEAGLSE